ncbi:MAG: TetR/AcrR family transcriptional regulator [Acidobacteriota bacterium]
MSSISATRAPRRSPKRDAVIEAATEEFLAHGFAGTSMDRIAQAANVSKRTVYNHFPSKDELFQAIVEEILRRSDEMPFHTYSPERALEDQLLEIGNTFADTITDRDFMKLAKVVTACFIQLPEWGQTTMSAYARLRKSMLAFFKAGKRDGRLKIGDPERAATQFCGLIKEAVFWPEVMAGQQPATSRERRIAVEDAVAIFLSYYAT